MEQVLCTNTDFSIILNMVFPDLGYEASQTITSQYLLKLSE